jgi:hypothetical protein
METTLSSEETKSAEDRRNWETQPISRWYRFYNGRNFPGAVCRLCYDQMKCDSRRPPSCWEILYDPGSDRDTFALKLNNHLLLSHADLLDSKTTDSTQVQENQHYKESTEIRPANALNFTSSNAITSSSSGYARPSSWERLGWEVMPNPITDGIWKYYLIYKSHYFPGFVCRYCYSQRMRFDVSETCSVFPWEILCVNIRSPAAPGSVLFQHLRQHPQIDVNEYEESRLDRSESTPTPQFPPLLPVSSSSASAATGNSAPTASCNNAIIRNSLQTSSGSDSFLVPSRRDWEVCENLDDISPVWNYFFIYKDSPLNISVCKSCYYDRKANLPLVPSCWWEIQHFSATNVGLKRNDLLYHLKKSHLASWTAIYYGKNRPPRTKHEITYLLKLNAHKRPAAVIPYPTSLPRIFNHFLAYKDASLINISVCRVCFEAKKHDPNKTPSSWEVDHCKYPNRTCRNLTDHYLTHHKIPRCNEENEQEVGEAVDNVEVIEIDDDSTVGSGVNSIPVANGNNTENDRRDWPVCENLHNDSDVIWKHFLVYKFRFYPAVICRYCYEEKKTDTTASSTSWEIASGTGSSVHLKKYLTTHVLQFHRNEYLRQVSGNELVTSKVPATDTASSLLAKNDSGECNSSSPPTGKQEHQNDLIDELSKQEEKEDGYRDKGGTENVDEMMTSDQDNEEEDNKVSESEDSNDESLVSIDDDESLVSVTEEKSLVSITDDESLVSIDDTDRDRRQWEVCDRTPGGSRPLVAVWKYFLVYKDRKVKQSVCKTCYHEKKNDPSCPSSSWEVNNGHLTSSLASHLRRYHYESYLEIRDQLPVSQKESVQLITVSPEVTSFNGHEERRNWEVCQQSGTSPLRKYFLVYKDHEVDESVCKRCYQNGKDKLSSPPSLWEVKHGNKTTSLNNHLRKYHPTIFAEVYPLLQRRKRGSFHSLQTEDPTKSERARQSEERRNLEVCESVKNANILIWNYFWEYKGKPGFAVCRTCYTEKKDLAHHTPSTWELQGRRKWRLEGHLKHRHTHSYVEYCRKTKDISEQRRNWGVCEKTGHVTLTWKYFYMYKDRDFKYGVCKVCYHDKKEDKTCSPDLWEVFPPCFEDHLERNHPPLYKQLYEQKQSGKQASKNDEIKNDCNRETIAVTKDNSVANKESGVIGGDSESRRHWEVCEKPFSRLDIWRYFFIYKDHDFPLSICKLCYFDLKDVSSCLPSAWEVKNQKVHMKTEHPEISLLLEN